jgi:hypothetical protein
MLSNKAHIDNIKRMFDDHNEALTRINDLKKRNP